MLLDRLGRFEVDYRTRAATSVRVRRHVAGKRESAGDEKGRNFECWWWGTGAVVHLVGCGEM